MSKEKHYITVSDGGARINTTVPKSFLETLQSRAATAELPVATYLTALLGPTGIREKAKAAGMFLSAYIQAAAAAVWHGMAAPAPKPKAVPPAPPSAPTSTAVRKKSHHSVGLYPGVSVTVTSATYRELVSLGHTYRVPLAQVLRACVAEGVPQPLELEHISNTLQREAEGDGLSVSAYAENLFWTNKGSVTAEMLATHALIPGRLESPFVKEDVTRTRGTRSVSLGNGRQVQFPLDAYDKVSGASEMYGVPISQVMRACVWMDAKNPNLEAWGISAFVDEAVGNDRTKVVPYLVGIVTKYVFKLTKVELDAAATGATCSKINESVVHNAQWLRAAIEEPLAAQLKLVREQAADAAERDFLKEVFDRAKKALETMPLATLKL